MISRIFVKKVVSLGISALVDRAIVGDRPSAEAPQGEPTAGPGLAPISSDLTTFFRTKPRVEQPKPSPVTAAPIEVAPAVSISSASQYTGLSQISAEGKACIPCGNDHFSTAAGALSESLRFAAKGGLTHPEVLSRITLAMDEYNVFERVDGAPEKLAKLPPGEKAIMVDMMERSREMRHQLGDAFDYASLEAASAQARNNRIELMGKTLMLRQGQQN